MLRTYIAAKIQGLTVTDASIDYTGSVTIDQEVLAAAGIEPYEQVHVVNLSNGARWITYALPGAPGGGALTLNGGGARLGLPGDRCVVMTFVQAERAPGAAVVFCDHGNRIVERLRYPAAGPVPAP